jgi:hypothetical protein
MATAWTMRLSPRPKPQAAQVEQLGHVWPKQERSSVDVGRAYGHPPAEDTQMKSEQPQQEAVGKEPP